MKMSLLIFPFLVISLNVYASHDTIPTDADDSAQPTSSDTSTTSTSDSSSVGSK